MKTLKTIPIVSLSLLMAGCVAPDDRFVAAPDCPGNTPTFRLTGALGNERAPTNIGVAPNQVTVRVGCPFDIDFATSGANSLPSGSSVSTFTSDPDGYWIFRSGRTQPFSIIPPADAAGNTGSQAYKFSIYISGLGIIDPRAIVIEN